jgi:hypothetical protein
MEPANLEARWNDMMGGVFESFIEMYVGTDAEGRPACLGTGDGHPWCVHCPYHDVC